MVIETIEINTHVRKYIILQFLDTIAANASSDSELINIPYFEMPE